MRDFWTVVAASLMVFARCVMAADEMPPTPNLVIDSSLEGYIRNNGLPHHWELDPHEYSKLTAFIQSQGHTGDRCLRLQSSGEWGSVRTPRTKVQPGALQVGQVWYRLSPPGKDQLPDKGQLIVEITYFNDQGEMIGFSPRQIINLVAQKERQDWKSVEVRYPGSRFANARTFSLTAGLQHPGTVLLDDFRLHQTEVAPGTNIVPHGDMEFAAEEFAKAFPVVTANPETTTVQRTEMNPHDGKACLRVVGLASKTKVTILKMEIPAGKSIGGTAWIRADRGSGQFRLFAARDATTILDQELPFDSSPVWKQSSWKLTPDQLRDATVLEFHLAADKNFDVCLDDVAVWVK